MSFQVLDDFQTDFPKIDPTRTDKYSNRKYFPNENKTSPFGEGTPQREGKVMFDRFRMDQLWQVKEVEKSPFPLEVRNVRQKTQVYDDNGNSTESKPNHRCMYFYILATTPRVGKELQAAFSFTPSRLQKGDLSFGIKNPPDAKRYKQPTYLGSNDRLSKRMTILDINRQLLQRFFTPAKSDTSTIPKPTMTQVHQRIFFSGAVLMTNNTRPMGESHASEYDYINDPNIHGQTDADTLMPRTADHVVLGTTDVLNIWGVVCTQSALCKRDIEGTNGKMDFRNTHSISAGARLYILLRWLPYDATRRCLLSPWAVRNCYTQQTRTMIENASTNGIIWVPQLVPVATMEDRPPFYMLHSPRGSGYLIFIGTVVRNNNSYNGDTSLGMDTLFDAMCFHRASHEFYKVHQDGNFDLKHCREMIGTLTININRKFKGLPIF